MEVKNQMVDQLLVNTAAQAPASQNTKAAKDADHPDFDSMVQKRSAEKSVQKVGKTVVKDAARGTAEAPAEENPVADEQYAIAAAMMFQAQPDVRMVPVEAEAVETMPEITVEAAQADAAETQVELPEVQIAQEVPAEAVAEAAPEMAAPETAPVETPAQEAEAPVQPRDTGKPEAEAKPDETEREAERPEQLSGQEPRMVQDDAAPRTEKAPEAQRFVRETKPETEDDSETENTVETPAEAPLFNRVDTTVVKVAEASKPIPLEAEDGVEQLGREIGDVIVNDVSANRIEVQLTPGNLGKLTVEITRGEDGTLHIVLHTENQRAANLLEKGMDGLRQAIAANRDNGAQIEVRGSEESREQFLNPDGQNEQNRQQQQQHNGRRNGQQQNAQDFLQQLRLGLVDVDEDKNG